MGQYHLVVNLDKRQFLMPHQLGDGLKLWEQVASGPGGTASALLALLAVSNGRGGGDLDENELIGSWGGDRIAVVGDYAEPTDLPEEFEADKIYHRCVSADYAVKYAEDYADVPVSERYRDITPDVQKMLAKNLGVTYSGTGWRDRKFGDGSDSRVAMKPDMIISGGL